MVVSPPALEEPFDEAVRAGGQSGHLRQLDFDGAGVAGEQGLAAEGGAQAEELREAGADDARGHHGRKPRGAPLLREPRGARRQPFFARGADRLARATPRATEVHKRYTKGKI